ncbi:GFA family protein [Microvirga makkahensis]|uniref:GFA family protein n=1 Tax=Microvirga makkahensis TaxID=1128670 RepID=A0A7X3MUI2_9HYPH|nr:GFA family protein [Microvirga makkahensis]MXQ13411.1 GFA family protein [Microvirga makkahensis]
MENQNVLTGGCACGQLTFQVHGAPRRVGLCHCMTCRKTSGSAFNAFAVFSADRVTVSGESRSWEAAPGGWCHFCPRCGSQVFYRDGGAEIELMLGAFDDTDLFKPTYETWTKRRESWLCTPDLTGYPENRGEVTS